MTSGKKKLENRKEWMYSLPIVVVFFFVTIMVHAHVYENTTNVDLYGYGNATLSMDFLGHYKAVFMLVGAVSMVLLLLYRYFSEDAFTLPRSKAFIPLGVYAVFVILSACFSKYKQYAFHGMPGLEESMWVILAYIMTGLYAFFMINTEGMRKKFVLLFKVTMTFLCAYGVLELIFGNPIGWEWMKYVIFSGKQLATYGDARELSFQGLTLTLYNSNYVASLLALTIPFTLVVFMQEKKAYGKIWTGVLFIVQWILLVDSKARSAVPAVVLALLVIGVCFRKQLLKQKKLVFGGIALVILAFLAVEIPTGFAYSKRFAGLFTYTETTNLESMETLSDSVEIVYNGRRLEVKYQGYDSDKPFQVTCDGEEILYQENNGIWETDQSDIAKVQFAVTGSEQYDCFDIGIEGMAWRFIDGKDEGGYYYVNPEKYPVKLETAKKILPQKYWKFGSGRGYIWAKSIPLLKEHIILGSGPDTFYMVCPWNDYVDQSKVMAKEKIFNRPHSMYLQMGIQTGMVSLLAFLTFAIWYLIASVKLYGKQFLGEKKQGYFPEELLGLGIFAGVFGYLITGFVNDSIIGVAQIFWCMIGLGFAMNHKVKERRRSNEGV